MSARDNGIALVGALTIVSLGCVFAGAVALKMLEKMGENIEKGRV